MASVQLVSRKARGGKLGRSSLYKWEHVQLKVAVCAVQAAPASVQRGGAAGGAVPAAGPRGAPRGHQRPTRGRQGPVSAPNVEYWRDMLPAWRHCYFRSFKTVSLGTKLNEASMVTLTHIFFFCSSICNLALCVCT